MKDNRFTITFLNELYGLGVAIGDYDNGGRDDVHITALAGDRNRIGAVARVTSEDGKQWQTVHSGSNYCSSSDPTLTFGFGKDPSATWIEIEWPSGAIQKLANTPAQQLVVVTEP